MYCDGKAAAMTEGKRKGDQMPVRGTQQFRELADRMRKKHGTTWSEYVRGLVVMDAVRMGEPFGSVGCPDWCMEDVLRLHRESIVNPKGSRVRHGGE